MGNKIYVTGKVAGRTKKETRAFVEEHGFAWPATISKNLDLLVTGAKAGLKKLEKAEQLGIKVLPWETFVVDLNKEDRETKRHPLILRQLEYSGDIVQCHASSNDPSLATEGLWNTSLGDIEQLLALCWKERGNHTQIHSVDIETTSWIPKAYEGKANLKSLNRFNNMFNYCQINHYKACFSIFSS
ncbi:MAG: BRCT domain-containing protein [Candidatus Heimdallarchaeota archaeon]